MSEQTSSHDTNTIVPTVDTIRQALRDAGIPEPHENKNFHGQVYNINAGFSVDEITRHGRRWAQITPHDMCIPYPDLVNPRFMDHSNIFKDNKGEDLPGPEMLLDILNDAGIITRGHTITSCIVKAKWHSSVVVFMLVIPLDDAPEPEPAHPTTV